MSLKKFQAIIAVCAYILAIATAGTGQEGLLISVGMIVVLVIFIRGWIRDLRRLANLPDEAFQGRPGRRYWMIMLIAFAPIGLWMFRSSFPPHLFSSVDSDT